MRVELLPLAGLPEVHEADPLGELIAGRAELRDDDVVVVSQKIVSKAEGAVRDLDRVEPSPRARELAAELDKDPALVEVILGETRELVRAERGVLITETHHGWICANAGVDASNVPERSVTLLPRDADASAARIRGEIEAASGVRPAVLIADSFGRVWRIGQADIAIGCAGLAPLDDWRGREDRDGNRLTATVIAAADEIAAAADLARDKAEGIPVVVVRGVGRYVTGADGPGAGPLRRARADDLFR